MYSIGWFCWIYICVFEIIIGSAVDDQLNRVKRANGPTSLNATFTTSAEWTYVTDIWISDKIPLVLTITVPEGTEHLYANFTSSINNVENIFSFCSVHISNIGTNLGSISPSDFTATYEHNGMPITDTTGLYKADSAFIDFATLINTGDDANLTENQIVIELDVIVVNAITFTDGEAYTVSATADYGDGSEVWTDSITFNAVDQVLFSITPPLFTLSGPTNITIGGVANWTVVMNLRDAVNKIHIEAWINGTYSYSSCYMYLADKGLNYMCLQENGATVTTDGIRALFDLPTVINTGFNTINTTNDADNDVIVNVLTRIPSYVTSSDEVYLNIELYVDDKLAWYASEALVLDSGVLPPPAGSATVQLGTIDGVTTIAKGSGLVFTIHIKTPTGSVTSYGIVVNTNAGKASICDVRIMRIGKNVCMDNSLTVTFLATDGSNVTNRATVDALSVANVIPDAVGNDIENEFRLEAIVCIPDYSSALVGNNLMLSVAVTYGVSTISDTQAYSVSATSDPSQATGNITFISSTPVPGKISEIVQLNVTSTIVSMTDKFSLTVEVPISGGTALATIENVSLEMGKNFACHSNPTWTVSETVLTSYSQTTKVLLDIGYLVNTGTYDRNPFAQPDGTENNINIQIWLRVADHVLNTQNSLIDVNTTLSGQSGISASGIDNIQVQITGTEAPELMFEVEMETFKYDEKVSGDNVNVSVMMYLSINSTAHAQDVVVHFLLPYYVSFGELLAEENAAITLNPLTADLGITFSISEVDFYDNVSFLFSLVLDPDRQMPVAIDNLQTVVPFDMTYRGELRVDRVDTGVLHSGLLISEFGFTTDLPSSLGLQIRTIQDCQLTATSSLPSHMPSEARLYSSTGWKPLVRGRPFCLEEYIQIHLGTSAFITGIQLQSSYDSYLDIVTSFQLQYSDDSIVWYDVTGYDDITPVTFTIDATSGSSVDDVYDVDINATYSFTATYVRLLPAMPSCMFGLRLELMGLIQSGPAVDCTTYIITNSYFADQSYTVNTDTGTTFVCGVSGIGNVASCSRSDDVSDYWQDIDDSVANVIGVVTNTSLALGLSKDGVTHMRSDDDGLTWDAITTEEVTEIQSEPGYVTMVTFPYEDTRGETYDDMYTTYGTDGNDFALTGCLEGVAVKPSASSWDVVAWWGTEDWSLLV